MEAAEDVLVPSLDEAPHQFGGSKEEHGEASSGGLDTERDGEHGLPSPYRSGEDHVLGVLQVGAAGQFEDLGA
jgi:hypothetical protein